MFLLNKIMLFKYKVIVKLKDDIKDAKGEAVKNVLQNIQPDVKNSFVLVGKYFEFDIEAIDKEIAQQKAINIIEEVFINPILETYDILEVECL